MLLGKRPRGPMRRTASMTGITVDLPGNVDAGSSEPNSDNFNDTLHLTARPEDGPPPYHHSNNMVGAFDGGNTSGFLLHDQRLLATMVSPRNHYRSGGSGDHLVEAAHFLRTCGLCKRRLGPGKDLFMYRGDMAFCSQECREQQMKQDAKKEKGHVMIASKKEDRRASASTTSSKSSRKSETLAAA
ncbi:FCS-LIKE ZINC FINGER 5 [Salix viminalis]|uniref:FCS-LIKE ZINC FINGER 5 n=1 Tax=Salix viminalis TaxID=40686 RepID=A0A9Q0NY32_SALVM|nr:FCS-LIKE ZINC FINGER 5 [Salix viminalis]